MVYTNFLSKLIMQKDSVVKELQCKHDDGVWIGSATIVHNNRAYVFELAYKSDDSEMALETLVGHNTFELSTILAPDVVKPGRTDAMRSYFHYYWNCWIADDGSLWLHPVGWFILNKGESNPSYILHNHLMELVGCNGSPDALNKKCYLPTFKLESLGFVKIL